MNLTTLTDDELEQLRIDVLNERERRENLLAIPDKIAQLRQTYIDGGGDPAGLD